MNAQRQKFGVGTFIFLFLFGSMFTAVGLFAIGSTKVDPSWTKVQGTVVDAEERRSSKGGTTYAAVVEYTEGEETNNVTSSFSSSFYPNVGETREVAYNPVQPGQAKVVEGLGASWFLYIFPVVGIVCILLAFYLFIKSLKRAGEIKRLMQSGQKLQGVLVDVQASATTSNGKHSYKLLVAATDNMGKVQNYESDSLSGAGAVVMMDFRNSPIPIDVYVDNANPKSYYVDISDIPNLTPERITELLKKAAGYSSMSNLT
ncbi:MAG TPA: DUF3592 domain-containing protein [Candidatus Paceibacterota bacterium]